MSVCLSDGLVTPSSLPIPDAVGPLSLFVCLSVCLSVPLPVCLSVRLSVCRSVRLSVCRSVRRSDLSVC